MSLNFRQSNKADYDQIRNRIGHNSEKFLNNPPYSNGQDKRKR